MPEQLVDQAARAILDGTPVNWATLESTGDRETESLVEQLKVLSTLANVHRTSPDAQWGHLQILEKVGSGAFGEVFRAWDTRLDREVALKLLPANAAANGAASPIIHEGRLLARVRHPNVATIYGAELIDGRIGLWMEFVRGRTLEELLRAGHQFNLHEVMQIGVDLCRAVSAVHAAGLIHRDVKAENVMRADDGHLVLMDFGAGLERADKHAEGAGTPLYLAPEIFRGEPATEQSDQYGVAVLLYHLLTGAYPVRASTIEDLKRAHEQNGRQDLSTARPDLPPAIFPIFRRALDPNPAQRYDTCDALAAELAAISRPPIRRRWFLTLAAAAAVVGIVSVGWWVIAASGVSHRPVIAVLPFENRSGDAGNDLIVEGLTLELIRNLAIIEGVDVKSATSTFALKGKPRDLAEIGKRLGVNMVLEGSLLQSGDQWRVHAQLVRVAGDTPLWSHKFDRANTAMFVIPDEISLAVVNELRLKVVGGQRRYDLDQETSATYLKALALAARRGSPSEAEAVKLFEAVIARDPTFAPAHAGLAGAYAFFSQDLPDVGGLKPDLALALMRPAAEKAIELDPLLAEAHAAMGILHSRENAWEEAIKEFRRAIELNPSLTYVRTDYALTTLLPLGRFAEAEALLQEALRRDPLSAFVARELGSQYLAAGRYEEAIRSFDNALALEPDLPYTMLLRARALSLAGRIPEAMPYWEANKDKIGSQQWMAYAFVRSGRRQEVEAMTASQGLYETYRLAIIHTALGNVDLALDNLEKAADEVPHRVVRLLVYPEMASLRGLPRFEALRVKFRLQ